MPHEYAALWSGEKQRNVALELEHVQQVEIALAYCKADISWLTDEIVHYLESYRKKTDDDDPIIKITILSKCGYEDDIPDFEGDINKNLDAGTNTDANFERINVKVNTISLVNKGGCDLAYSHYIDQYLQKRTVATAENSVLLFLKDTPRTMDSIHQSGRWRSIPEMIYYASQGEFICGIKTTCDKSVFHDTNLIKKYSMKDYIRHGDKRISGEGFNGGDYRNLGDFLEKELDWRFPNEDLTEVCYGGTFAVPATRLFAEPKLGKDVKRFGQILRDGASMTIVEHFAERLWAPFLTNPLGEADTQHVLNLMQSIDAKNGSYMGTLMSPRIERCESKIKF